MRAAALGVAVLLAAAPASATLYESDDDPVVTEFRSLLIRMIVARNDGNAELYARLRAVDQKAREAERGPDELDPIAVLISSWSNHRFNYLKVDGEQARLAYHARIDRPAADLLYARCRIYVMFRLLGGEWRVGSIGGVDCFARSPLPPPHSSITQKEFRLPSDW